MGKSFENREDPNILGFCNFCQPFGENTLLKNAPKPKTKIFKNYSLFKQPNYSWAKYAPVASRGESVYNSVVDLRGYLSPGKYFRTGVNYFRNSFRNCLSAQRLGGINSEMWGSEGPWRSPWAHGPHGPKGPFRFELIQEPVSESGSFRINSQSFSGSEVFCRPQLHCLR